jgi:hypothetical protein
MGSRAGMTRWRRKLDPIFRKKASCEETWYLVLHQLVKNTVLKINLMTARHHEQLLEAFGRQFIPLKHWKAFPSLHGIRTQKQNHENCIKLMAIFLPPESHFPLLANLPVK